MIFVTVGTQGHFDRLVRTVDEWAGKHGRTDVFAQTGPSDASYRHIRSEQFVDPAKFREYVESASLVIAHAGMGSIITALELGKRIIVMPRRASMGEQRNDHQMATARRFAQQGRIEVAFDERELLDKLDHLDVIDETEPLSPQASQDLIASIRTFIRTGHVDVEAHRLRYDQMALQNCRSSVPSARREDTGLDFVRSSVVVQIPGAVGSEPK